MWRDCCEEDCSWPAHWAFRPLGALREYEKFCCDEDLPFHLDPAVENVVRAIEPQGTELGEGG